MVEGLENELVRVEDEDPFERGYVLMEAESDQLEENVGVVWFIVVVERRRFVRDDCSILSCEEGEIFGANCRLDKDYNPLLGVKDIVEAMYVDKY